MNNMSAGWLVVEVRPEDIPYVQKANIEEIYFYPLQKNKGIKPDSANHEIGLVNTVITVAGFKEEMGLSLNGVHRYLYSYTKEQADVKTLYSMMHSLQNLPLKISGLGIGGFGGDDIIYTLLEKGKLIAEMSWGENTTPKFLSLIKKINSALVLKEKAMLAFSNPYLSRVLNRIDDLTNSSSKFN